MPSSIAAPGSPLFLPAMRNEQIFYASIVPDPVRKYKPFGGYIVYKHSNQCNKNAP